jgi:hypothetical protein
MEMLKKFSMLVAMIALGLALSNCAKDGATGPAGKDGANGANGADGKDGKDGNATCGVCHADNADAVNLIFAQYDLSMHNRGIVYEEEAGRIGCGGCHSGDGFAEAVKLGTDDPKTIATSKISCRACHPIHSAYDESDFALRYNSPVKLRIGGNEVNFKDGNTCAKCHQGRTFNSVVGADTTFKTAGSTTYTRYGPHYGTPANVFSMNGLYAVAGPETVPTTNVHANLSKGCVSCHMGSNATNPAVGGHSFLMTAAQLTTVEECKTCHPGGEFSTTPKGKEIASMLAETRQILLDKGWLDISQTTSHDGSYQLLGEYFKQSKEGITMTKEQVEIMLNYLYIAKDRSMGAHNPRYVYALVKNGLEKLKQ